MNSICEYATALQYAINALQLQRKVLPESHPDIATSLSNIGCSYRDLGDHALALKCALEALEMQRKVLPEPHPDIATSLSNISCRYRDLGDHALALKCALEALEMRRKVLPEQHAHIATSLKSLQALRWRLRLQRARHPLGVAAGVVFAYFIHLLLVEKLRRGGRAPLGR